MAADEVDIVASISALIEITVDPMTVFALTQAVRQLKKIMHQKLGK
ncbi:MAG: hypothetical protein ACM4D3_09270 [Candidatus Sericytochromatia bacterium]